MHICLFALCSNNQR